MSWKTTLNIALVAATLLQGEVQALPDSFRAEYTLSSKGMVLGATTYTLRQATADHPNRFTIHTEPTGLAALFIKKIIDEESTWEWHDGEIRPIQYSYRQVGKREKSKSRHFDWDSGSVLVEDNGSSKKLDQLQGNTVDEAVFLLTLMHDLERGNSSLAYRVAKSGGWSNYSFTIGESEEIEVPAGSFSAKRITRQKQGKRTFELWSAPDLHYLPIQVEYRDKRGTLFRLQLRSSSIYPPVAPSNNR